MLSKTATRTFLAAGMLLAFAACSLLAQGIPTQSYNGLDKYPSQGREESLSFAGVRAAEFLTIPVGARGIGMGSAYTAVAEGVSAMWWNPAGLGFLQKKEVMLTVVDYTMDLTYSYAAFAAPIADGNLVVGGFFGYLDVPDMEVTTISRPEGTGQLFNAYDFQAGGSVAYSLSDRFMAGVNFKFVHQDVFGNLSGNAFAIDAGGIYHTELLDREIRFSFAIQNLGTNITMSGAKLLAAAGPENRDYEIPGGYEEFGSDPYAFSRRNARQVYYKTNTYRLPTTVKLALAYNLYTSESTNWLVSTELWRPSYIPVSYAAGTELTYNFDQLTTAALRMGWQIQTDEFTDAADDFGDSYFGDDPSFRGLSFGGGIKRSFAGRDISFNYAYKNKGRLSADNFFTVAFGF